jgi:serine/threonine-protein kinase RsbW
LIASFSVRLPADADSVTFVRTVCRAALTHRRVEPAVIEDISLALTEACANVVQHAETADAFEVEVELGPQECRIVVRDEGVGFDLTAVQSSPPGSVLEGGRGIFLMRTLMDDLHFGPAPDGGHELVLRRRLVTSPPLASDPV